MVKIPTDSISCTGNKGIPTKYLGKPLLVLRSETERPEVVEAGIAKKVGTNETSIIKEARILLDDCKEYNRRAQRKNLYGDGQASARIVQTILTYDNIYPI